MNFQTSRYLLPVHIIQLILILAIIGLSVPRLFMKNQPRTRANTIALGMGAKSIIIISYQILTEHVSKFRRWASWKANTILNSLEIVFWAAVVFLVIQGNIQACARIGCILSWIVVGLAVIMSLLAMYTATISYFMFRSTRRRNDVESSDVGKMEEVKKMAS